MSLIERQLAPLWILAALFVCGLTRADEPPESLVLRVGGSHVYPAENVANVDLPAVNVATTKLVDDPPQIVVTGVSEGQATLILWMREPKGERKTILIDVVKRLPEEIQKDIQEILATETMFKPVETRVVGAKVLIFGLPNKAAYEHLSQTLSNYEKQIILPPPGPPKLAEEIQAVVAPWPNVKVRQPGPMVVVVDGKVLPRALPRVQGIVKQMGVNDYGIKVIDMVEADPQRKQIELAVSFAEMKREDLLNLGVDWADRINLTVNADVTYQKDEDSESKNPFSDLVGLFTGKGATEFAIIINISKEDTLTRTHDEYKVVVSDGSKAEYRRASTIHVPVRGVETAELEEIEFGAVMKITPHLLDNGKIELEMDVTVSSLASDAQSQRLTVQNNVTKQRVQMEPGQSMALWDVVQHSDADAIDAVPGLGKVPALGELFKSRDFQDRKSEAVIWVTPTFTSPDSDSNKDMRNLLKRMKDTEL